MNWLLPANTLLQLIGSGNTPARQWADTVDTRALRTSVISIAQANTKIQSVTDASIRTRLEADLSTLLAHMKADSGVGPLSFSLQHAMMWSHLCMDASLHPIGQIDRQVYSTALHEGLTVAEPARAEHIAIQAVGVRIHAL